MDKKLFAISIAASAIVIAASAIPASAALLGVHATTTVAVKLDTAAKTKADAQIDARVKVLNVLLARVNQMQKVTAQEKVTLDASIQASISEMTALKAKIDADTDNTILKADIQSITKGYRIYLLVLPQGRITAAADRIITIVGLMGDLSTKLQSRITAAQAAGQDVTSLNASLTDMNAKTADANAQAQAAILEVANLQPDGGNQSVFQSNLTALKDAHVKIRAAIADLKTARQDAGSIVRALTAMKIKTSATSSASSTLQ